LKYPGGILLKCIDEDQVAKVLNDMHARVCGWHLYWKATAYKILRACYYLPTLFSDTFEKIKACEQCQKFVGKQKVQSLPLKPVMSEKPF